MAEADKIDVEMKAAGIEDGTPVMTKPIVYKRRFFVLLSYILGYFFWNLAGNKQVILATSFAKYHNITNEVSFPSLGVDFLAIFASFLLIFTYNLGAFSVDKFGLISITVGNFGLMLSNWIWYLAFTNYNIVVLSIFVSSLMGPLVSVSILAISNRWFPEHERAKATAAGSFVGLLGSGAGVVIGPMFETGPTIVDFTLQSCKSSEVSNATIAAYINATLYNDTLLCEGDNANAYSAFCCYTPADIPLYNLIMALITTAVFFISVVSVRSLPPTPPAPAAKEKPKTPFFQAAKSVITNRRLVQVNMADFFVSGPPTVLFSTIARILPKEVKDYDSVMSISGVCLAIPACIIAAIYLDRHHTYWNLTFGAYCLATTLWMIAAIGYSAGGYGGGVVVIVAGVIAVVSFVAWQVSGYELKLEWGFRPDMNLEGAVAAFDRIVINISAMVFIVAIPPERLGGLATFWIGFGILLFGVIIAAFIPNKYEYRRLNFERGIENGASAQKS